jgi:hypothetical protein
MIKWKSEKEELKESPFNLHFEYGNGVDKEGYWTYDHMTLQFEDCVDFVLAIIQIIWVSGCLTTVVVMIGAENLDY